MEGVLFPDRGTLSLALATQSESVERQAVTVEKEPSKSLNRV